MPGETPSPTTFDWFYDKESKKLDPSLYTYDGKGHFTFHQAPEGEIFCVMHQKAFPDFDRNNGLKYRTDFLQLVGTKKTLEHPVIVLSTDKYTTDGNLKAELTLATAADGDKLTIDWGDGAKETVKGSVSPKTVSHHFLDSKVDLVHQVAIEGALREVGVEAGFYLLGVRGGSAAASLRKLSIRNNDLSKLATLDLSAFTGLETLEVEASHLTEIELGNGLTHLTRLSLASNQIASVKGFEKAVALRELTLSRNTLKAGDFRAFAALKTLKVDHNELASLSVPSTLETLDCSFNRLGLSDLPEKGALKMYRYMGQRSWRIPAEKIKHHRIDLSSETNLRGEANSTQITTFVWQSEKENRPLMGDEVREVHDGVFEFSLPNDMDIYCTMETAAFPQLASDTAPFRTQAVRMTDKNTPESSTTVTSVRVCVLSHGVVQISGLTAEEKTVRVQTPDGSLVQTAEVAPDGSVCLHLTRGFYIISSVKRTVKLFCR